MAEPISLLELLITPGVLSAIRWRPSVIHAQTPSPPRLLEWVGEITEERAQRLMQHAELGGVTLFSIAQLGHQRAPADKTVAYPIDAYYVHAQHVSVAATINRVAVLTDNAVEVDLQALIRKMIYVEN